MEKAESSGASPGRKPAANSRGDRILFVVLATVLLAASIAVTWQILTPSEREDILSRLTQEGLGILSAAQHYGMEVRAKDEDAAPFTRLRFDRIGYMDGLSVDGLERSTLDATYSLLIAPDSRSFDLVAQGPQGIQLIWEGVTVYKVPEVRIE